MAALDFSSAQAAASMAEGQQGSARTQSLLMQINADAVCLVRSQFQQLNGSTPSARARRISRASVIFIFVAVRSLEKA
jgi:hypothetical protein